LNQIIIINEIFQIEKIKEIKISNYQVFAINYEIHKKLDEENISHIIADELLSKEERDELYDFTVKKYKWFEENRLSKEFLFNDVNLFEITESGIIHENLLKMLIEGSIIKKIIVKYEPTLIYCSNEIFKFIKINFKGIKVKEISENTEQITLYDNIDFRLNIATRTIHFNISKNKYSKLKSMFDKITCNLFNLWYKKSSKQIILLVEFNPSLFKNLISTLSSEKYTLVFLNFRRPASWNLESINVLKNSKSKIINPKNFLPNENHDKIISDLRLKLENIFEEESFYEIFKFNNISFWPIINNKLKKIFSNRIPDQVKEIIIIKNIVKNLKLQCFICSNESGETERILGKTNKQKIKSILLQHGFSNFHEETDQIRMRIDERKLIPIVSDKFFVWGESDYKFFKKLGIDESKIVISGNPKFDDFPIVKKISKNQKIVLITPEPITESFGHYVTKLANEYENTLTRVCQILKKIEGVEIIVKLHPGQNSHNNILEKKINKIDKSIPIFQMKSSPEIVKESDLLLNITCEAVDPSTIMLEGLMLDKPVLEICLDKEFSFSNKGIITAFNNDNLEKIIHKMLFDKEFLEKNATNRNNLINNYLSNTRNSSKKILDYISNWN
jgi:UDP-N-acetylglucosamine 2-epimerase